MENCKYLRVTNLSTDQDMKVALVTANTNYQVTVRAGGSHILFQAEEALIGAGISAVIAKPSEFKVCSRVLILSLISFLFFVLKYAFY